MQDRNCGRWVHTRREHGCARRHAAVLRRAESCGRRYRRQEAFAARIGERPDQVAYALEAEHRVVDEERNRRNADVRVGGAGGGKGGHSARFGDALFENLPVLRFLVVHQHVAVDRLVKLALLA